MKFINVHALMLKIFYSSLLFFIVLIYPLHAQDKEWVPRMSELELYDILSRAETFQKNYEFYRAMDLAQQAKRIAKYYENRSVLAKVYRIIGKSHEANGDFGKATESYTKAIENANFTENKDFKAQVYDDLAQLTLLQKVPTERTSFYYYKVIEYADSRQDTLTLFTTYNKIAQLYLVNNMFDKVFQALYENSKYVDKISIPEHITKFNYLNAYYYTKKRNQQKADYYIQKINSTEIPTGFEDLYKIRSLIYYENGNFQKAYTDLLTLSEFEKNKLTKEKLKEVNIANAKFEVENYKNNLEQIKEDIQKKDTELQQWKTSIFLSGLTLFMTFAFLISTYRSSFLRKKLNADLMEKNRQLYEAKEAAEQISKLKSQFVSTVSHELRTPLYGVIGLTELLRENPDSEKRDSYLESLRFSGNYLLALINDVLQLSKIESNEIQVETAPFKLKSLIDSIQSSLHNNKHKNNNNFHVYIDPKIDPIINGDSVRLSQILINLVGNALKFTKNGNVWVNVKIREKTAYNYLLRFEIKDDGVGIPKEKQSTIFDNFSQVKNHESEYQGTGLGLSIVKKLIKLFGSEIHLESAEGAGSCFSFELKVGRTKQKLINVGEETQKFEDVGTTTKLNILVVDDNKINQIVTKNILTKKSYTVTLCSDGTEAVDAAKENTYDLILMDLNMPVMGGIEATEIIREFDKRTPIIALTAVEEKEVVKKAKSIGMNDLIVKPYDTHVFYQTIIKNVNESKSIKMKS